MEKIINYYYSPKLNEMSKILENTFVFIESYWI